MGFLDQVIEWVRSYISGRRQRVCVNGQYSDWKSVLCGVPQGSILGPLLFTLYINDISAWLNYCKFHMYADDLQIYIHFVLTNILDAINKMNDDISRIVLWARNHGLKLNPTKTQPIIICSTRLINTIDMNTVPPITVDGTLVPYCNKVKSLGIILNNTLTWSDAVVDTCKKVFSAIHSLKKLHNFLPQHMKLLLVKALIFPHYTYCSSVINDMTLALAGKLQRSQNYCIRFVYDLKRDDHVTPHYVASGILKLAESRNVKVLALLFTIIKSGLPKYLSDQFNFVSAVSARNSRTGSTTLRIPHHRTAIFDKSFYVTACRLWNALPADIRLIESRPRFVASLRSYYMDQMVVAAAR